MECAFQNTYDDSPSPTTPRLLSSGDLSPVPPPANNDYIVNSALSHCDSSVILATSSAMQQASQVCTPLTPTGQPPQVTLAPVPAVKGRLVKARVISKHMMHSHPARQSSPPLPPVPPSTQQCTLLNPPAGPVVLHQPQPSYLMHSQDARRRSSGYQSIVSSMRSRPSSPLPPPTPSPTSCSPRRVSLGTSPGLTEARRSLTQEESSICPRCGRCRCQQCREPQPLPRRRVYGRCVVSDKCCVDVLSCMIVPKFLFDHACCFCCCDDDDGAGGRNLPGITVSKHGGGKSSISGYGMEFSSDSGVCWGGPSSSISYGGVSFVYEDEPTSTSIDFGDAAASPRPSAAMSDWIQQAAAVSTPPPRLSDDPLACASRPHCCPRWTALACLSICLPCLCFYPAFRAGAKAVQWCYDKNVGLRGCQCKPTSSSSHSDTGGGGVATIKERDEASSATSPARCLFIVMEDTSH